MDLHPIRTENDYDRALNDIARYFDAQPEPGSPDGDRFDALAALIEDYEAKHWPVRGA